MKPYYRKATVKDAILVANNLREEDRMEMEGLGDHPLSLSFIVQLSNNTVSFLMKMGVLLE